jgi:hypothetical protein
VGFPQILELIFTFNSLTRRTSSFLNTSVKQSKVMTKTTEKPKPIIAVSAIEMTIAATMAGLFPS